MPMGAIFKIKGRKQLYLIFEINMKFPKLFHTFIPTMIKRTFTLVSSSKNQRRRKEMDHQYTHTTVPCF